MREVGAEIRRLREVRGWTGAQLAVYAGMAPSAVSQIETGRRNPNTGSLAKIAKALGVEVVDLFPKEQASLPDFEDERRGGRSFRIKLTSDFEGAGLVRETLVGDGIPFTEPELTSVNSYLDNTLRIRGEGGGPIATVSLARDNVDHDRVRMLAMYIVASGVLAPELSPEEGLATVRETMKETLVQ